MHQAGPMCHGERVEHRLEHGHGGVRRHRTPLPQQLPQRAALDQFHHQERVVAVAPVVVHGHQTGMVQARDGAGLELETSDELRVTGELRIHHLDGHGAVETRVQTAIHRRHAPTGDGSVDSVAALEERAEQRRTGHGHGGASCSSSGMRTGRSGPVVRW